MIKFFYVFIVAPVIVFGIVTNSQADLVNGEFELPEIADNSFSYLLEGTVGLGWQTTATDDKIEIWRNSFLGVDAYLGNQFAELNATQVSNLYQEVSGIAAGQYIGWEFAHRGRGGLDTMGLEITDLGSDNVLGGGDDTLLFSRYNFQDGNTAWGYYEGLTNLHSLGNTIRFSFLSLSSTSSVDPQSFGNFLDAVAFGVGEGPDPVPEPATMLLFGAGIAGLAGFRLRGKK